MIALTTLSNKKGFFTAPLQTASSMVMKYLVACCLVGVVLSTRARIFGTHL